MNGRVAVLGASGRMGQAQVRQLLAQYFTPVAVTRNGSIFDRPEFAGADIVSADYNDEPSVAAAVGGCEAIFFQPPAMSDPAVVWEQCLRVRDAALRSGTHRFILNSTMWAPDEPPCGQPLYDQVFRIENLFLSSAMAVTVFRPVLFMDNLLTNFARPALVGEGVYRYCHRPGLRATWISMDDVARFMIGAIDRADLVGQRITIGGPETLAIEEVLGILSESIGRPILHEYVEPRAFGEHAYTAFGGTSEEAKAAYGDFFDSFYTFNNHSPYRPFEVDMGPVRQLMPLSLTSLRDWAMQQDWRLDGSPPVGSVTG